MTFSLAGRCARTGMMGAVITTSSPAVGSRCIFARAGVGVVLTQFWTDPRLGPRGLSLLAEGCPADATVAALAASTAQRGWRQIAALDRDGRTGHYTGAHTLPALAGVAGTDCVAIGNILRNDGVPAAMVAAFTAPDAQPLAERLLAAADAGLEAGGEEKPLVSAALLIVHDAPIPYIDLRVDAADAPLTELRRLHALFAPQADDYQARALRPETVWV